MDVIAVVGSALVSASALLTCEHLQRRFFVPYLRTHPKEPRQTPLLRIGLGLDEDTYGPWDIIPAWRVLNRPVPTELLARQRTARVALALMPVLVIAGPLLLGFTRSPFVPIGWFGGLIVATVVTGWGSAISVSRHTYDEGLDRTSRIVLQLTLSLPVLVIVLVMLLVTGYRAR